MAMVFVYLHDSICQVAVFISIIYIFFMLIKTMCVGAFMWQYASASGLVLARLPNKISCLHVIMCVLVVVL